MKTYTTTISNAEEISYSKTSKTKNNINIVMLHGNFSSSRNMEPIMHELINKAFIIAPTMRGFGKSSYKRPIKSYKDLAEDIYMFMSETYPEIKNYYIFGHNIGGNVAVELAKLHPESVKGLVLLALSA